MAFSPVEIRHLKLGRAIVGYARDETDRVLTEIAESFEDVWRDRADLADKVEKLETDLHRYKDTETLLRATLISAEKAAAEQKDNARREAEQIVSEAHAEAREIKRTSLAELERLQAEARRVRGLLQSALMVVGPAVQEDVDRWPESTGTVSAEVA
ncbi:MAG TPA: DivIVA domain-containing protein [Gaiellaceae bacterium]